MAEKKEPGPQPVTNSILATVHFTKPRKRLGYGKGFVVRFAVHPRVGEILRVDQESIKQAGYDLHFMEWKIVEVSHQLNLDNDVKAFDATDLPLATLWVTVHPVESKKSRK